MVTGIMFRPARESSIARRRRAAFTGLLNQLPSDTGFGFVLVQHLDPQHESALTQLLARATTMPVHEDQYAAL